MSLKKKFGTDTKKVSEGVWITVTTNDDGSECRIKLSRMATSNRKFAQRLAKHRKNNRNRIGDDVMKAQQQMVEVFAETIIIDWENVEEYREDKKAENKYMPFNRENAIFLLTDLPDLFDLLTEESSRIENFQAADSEDDAKNSQPSLSTSFPTIQ